MNNAWTIGATLAAAASAIFAALQLWLSRHEANGRAAMSAISTIVDRLHPLLAIDTRKAQKDILRCYREKCAMDNDAAQYMSFLDAVDVAALAAFEGLAAKSLLKEYLKTVVGPTHMVSLEFVEQLQDCCHDSGIYEHLRRFAADAKKDRDKTLGHRGSSE